jgi:hypothetical protein
MMEKIERPEFIPCSEGLPRDGGKFSGKWKIILREVFLSPPEEK